MDTTQNQSKPADDSDTTLGKLQCIQCGAELFTDTVSEDQSSKILLATNDVGLA